jgi:hypothetical protein
LTGQEDKIMKLTRNTLIKAALAAASLLLISSPLIADMRGGGLYFGWSWPPEAAYGISSLDMDLTIRNDPATSDVLFFSTELYCGTPSLRNAFYFGLQTNVQGQGKGLIFSRFGTQDASDAEAAGTADSWAVSSDTEGGFVGVRRLYSWTSHHYRLRLRAIRDDSVGRWFGFSLFDVDSGTNSYAGALRFPKDAAGQFPHIMTEGFGSFVEHATSVSSPALVPFWDLTVGRPTANNDVYAAITANWWYALPSDAWQNSDLWAEGNDIRVRMGSDTVRTHTAGQLAYKEARRRAAGSG